MVKEAFQITEYLNLARRLAWSFHRSTGLDLDELMGEAMLALVRSVPKYDPTRAEPSTFVYLRIEKRLSVVYRSQRRRESREVLEEVKDDSPYHPTTGLSAERVAEFREMITKSSQDCQDICRIIFEAPQDFINYAGKGAIGSLYNVLYGKGWSDREIWKAFKEIKTLLTR